MILDSLNLFKTNNIKVKVFGERNSATVYLEWLLRNNLKIDLLDYYTLGWKHRLAPKREEIEELGDESVHFLCLVKNPYSWLLSMHRKPYGQEKLSGLEFSQFLRFPYGDYKNPVVMWNIKNQALVSLKNHVKNHRLILYEDLLKEPRSVIEAFAVEFGIDKSRHWFMNQEKYISNNHGITKHPFHKSYYLEEKWRKEYKPEYLKFIQSQLDTELMNLLHYEII